MRITFRTVSFCVMVYCLLSTRHVAAQGTIYFSNLGVTPTGDAAVASDSWIAQPIITGTNVGGYVLNSIQMLMTPSSGTPSTFKLLIYDVSPSGQFVEPGTAISSLTGSDPSAGGVFTYVASGVLLSPARFYFLVASAASPVSTGSFGWSTTTSDVAQRTDAWGIGGFYYSSPDGLSWQISRDHNFQFAVNATQIPEPASFALLCCGGVLLAGHWLRRMRRRE